MSGNSRTLRVIVSAVLLASLAACGGGGGDSGTLASSGSTASTGGSGSGGGGGTTAAVVDKYVGTWLSPCSSGTNGPGTSSSDILQLQKATDTSVTFSDAQQNFTNTSCSGTPASTKTNTGTGTWIGSKTLATGESVDEINTVENSGSNAGVTQKQIITIKADGKLYSGIQASDGGTVDANGYPNTLEAVGSTKQ